MGYFSDKTILVTGASSGIGKALSIRLSKEDARVILIARNEEKLNAMRGEMSQAQKHEYIAFDLKNIDNYKQLFLSIKEKQIKLDGLVHCAGETKILPLRAMNHDNVHDLFLVHYYAFLELVKWYARKDISNGGSIVAISSGDAHNPCKCMTAYASAKAAVETACHNLAFELIDRNICINSVVMGRVDTPMTQNYDKLIGDYKEVKYSQLLGVAKPDQVVGSILFLLNREESFITGKELYVDGGLY